MKKWISLLLALCLLCAAFAAAAEETETKTETIRMPFAGMDVTLPEAFAEAKGTLQMDGPLEFTDTILYTGMVYIGATEEEYAAAEQDPPYAILYYLFSLGDGMDFSKFNAMVNNTFDPGNAVKLGEAGDWTYYLYMRDPDAEFTASAGAEFTEEYTELLGMKDQIAAGIACYEPYQPPVVFTTTDLDGNEVSSADLFAGNDVTMINVWATWCGPCVNELEDLQARHKQLQAQGGGIVGLLYDSNEDALEKAKAYIEQYGITYPMLWAPENLAEIIMVSGYPTSYFVGRDGTVLADPVVGAYPDLYDAALEAAFAPAKTEE